MNCFRAAFFSVTNKFDKNRQEYSTCLALEQCSEYNCHRICRSWYQFVRVKLKIFRVRQETNILDVDSIPFNAKFGSKQVVFFFNANKKIFMCTIKGHKSNLHARIKTIAINIVVLPRHCQKYVTGISTITFGFSTVLTWKKCYNLPEITIWAYKRNFKFGNIRQHYVFYIEKSVFLSLLKVIGIALK